MASHPSAPEVTQRIHADSAGVDGHRFRYHLAAGFLERGDRVLDAACGIGYGAEILQARGGVTYTGVDWDLSEVAVAGGIGRRFVEADLRVWVPDEGFDVFVGFETIEHLSSYEHYLVVAKQARRRLLLSTPVVPTTHLNPHHAHNFAPGQLAAMVVDTDWTLLQSVLQPAELSEIYVFGRE
jgi:SAM-dependent methyltransferase